MSTSIAREHLKLALQRTAILNDEAKRQNASSEDVKTQRLQKNIATNSERAKTKSGTKRKASEIQNAFMDAVTTHKGNRSELQRQLKRAKKIVDPAAAEDKEVLERKRKERMLKMNVQLLTRTSIALKEASKSAEKVSSPFDHTTQMCHESTNHLTKQTLFEFIFYSMRRRQCSPS